MLDDSCFFDFRDFYLILELWIEVYELKFSLIDSKFHFCLPGEFLSSSISCELIFSKENEKKSKKLTLDFASRH